MFPDRLPTLATPFIGRTEELTEIARLLADPNCRLLTLVGPGGMGKTRLAIEVAQRLPFPAVYFIALQPLNSPDFLVSSIAEVIGFEFYSGSDLKQQLLDYLREKPCLLLLDNFEHLLGGIDLLIDILQAAPDVKLLVTSRERLNVQEEWVLVVDGLTFPNDPASRPLESYSAVQLFVARARQAQARFSLEENDKAVQVICQSVEGMPLGLELAATWLRAMTCAQIAAHITSSLDFLTTPLRNVPERHRSLRVVFEQSWKLLSDDERAVLMRLSILRGGFDLKAAESVAGATLALLAGLVDKSLVRLGVSGRYDLHELLRQYAADRLTDAGEVNITVQRHFDYFLSLASAAEAHLFGREQIAWLDRLEAELDNLRAALTWSMEAEQSLHLAGTLGAFFVLRMHFEEGLAWLEQVSAANPEASASLRAKALNYMGQLAARLGNRERGRALCEQALTLARANNDRWNIASALRRLAFQIAENFDQSPALLEESLALFRELGDRMEVSHVLLQRAFVAVEHRDYAYARVLIEEDLILAHTAGDLFVLAHAHSLLGKLSWLQDHDLLTARTHFEISVAHFREVHFLLGWVESLGFLGTVERVLGNTAHAQALLQQAVVLLQEKGALPRYYIDFPLAGLASIARERGQFEHATRLLGAMDAGVIAGFENSYPEILSLREDILALRAQLGEKAFAEAWAAGHAMPREQAIACALQSETLVAEPAENLPETQRSGADNPSLIEPLSQRELEVLRLMAEGASNGEIALQLVIGISTVKKHINHLFSKLGVETRTQALVRARALHLL